MPAVTVVALPHLANWRGLRSSDCRSQFQPTAPAQEGPMTPLSGGVSWAGCGLQRFFSSCRCPTCSPARKRQGKEKGRPARAPHNNTCSHGNFLLVPFARCSDFAEETVTLI